MGHLHFGFSLWWIELFLKVSGILCLMSLFMTFIVCYIGLRHETEMVLIKTLHYCVMDYSRSNNLDTCGVQYFAGMSIFCILQYNRVVRDLCKAHNAKWTMEMADLLHKLIEKHGQPHTHSIKTKWKQTMENASLGQTISKWLH